MKKAGTTLLISLTCLFLGVAIGLLITKYSNRLTIVFPNQWPAEVTQTELPLSMGKININTASLRELCMLPGIGKETAEKIIAYRERHGVYMDPKDLLNVEGIGKKKLENILEYITVISGG